jgi:hypothetical protein
VARGWIFVVTASPSLKHRRRISSGGITKLGDQSISGDTKTGSVIEAARQLRILDELKRA